MIDFTRAVAEPLLSVRSLTKRFGRLVVLDEVQFTLEPGEIIGLVGRRGSGKTSLLQTIAGVAQPTTGEVWLNGQRAVLTSPRIARDLGIELLHETPHLVEQLDIIGNIFLKREICHPAWLGIPDTDRMYQRAKELLAEFDMPASLLTEKTANLSDEYRQVVAIARSLCYPPRLLLVDEAMASLSFSRQQIMLERMKALAAHGSGVIISSENLKHLFSVTNRILVLYEGHLVIDQRTADCTPRDIVEMIIGSSSREQVTPVVWALESFHAAQRQTEELFRAQAALHTSLEASDSLNRQLVGRLSNQLRALDRLNSALQETQRRLMTESEEERKALARDLHDEVIQDLLSYIYRLEDASDNLTCEEDRVELDAIRNGIRQVVSDLRQMCQDLRPPTIDNHGLPSAIRSLAQEWAERNRVELHLNIDPALGRLPESIELSVFRIVQEGLNNIRKHAAARNVQLSLYLTPMDNLMIELSDDGLGITAPPDLASLSASKHFGLLGISERAALLGGWMNVQSPAGGGLILQVEIPSPYPSV
jgi:signal transduction histidine kinase